MSGLSKKTAVYESGSWSSLDTEPAKALTLDFPVCRTVINKCLLFKPLVNIFLCQCSPLPLLSLSRSVPQSGLPFGYFSPFTVGVFLWFIYSDLCVFHLFPYFPVSFVKPLENCSSPIFTFCFMIFMPIHASF